MRVSDVVRAVWSTRKSVAGSFSIGVAAALLYLAFASEWLPSVTSRQALISLDVRGAKAGYYPNGVVYSPTDIRSPAVMQSVYSALGLSQYGLSRSDLDTALSVFPYSATRGQIDLRYKALAANSNLSFEERSRIEADYAKALEGAVPDGALITLTFPDSKRIPATVSEKIIDAVLSKWSQLYVQDLGASNAPDSVDSKILIDESDVAGLDYVLAYRYLDGAQAELATRIDGLSQVPGISDVAIGSSGRRLKDVYRDVKAIGALRLDQTLKPLAYSGMSKEAEVTARKLKAAVVDTAEAKAATEQKIRLIDEIVAQTTSVSRTTGASSQQEGATLSQLSDSTVTQLIDLAVKNADRPYIRELLAEKQKLGSDVADAARRISELERLTTALSARQQSTPPFNAASSKQFEQVALIAVRDMNELWAELNQLAITVSDSRLNGEKTVYEKVPMRDAEVVSGGLHDTWPWAIAVAIILFFSFAGMSLHLMRNALQPEQN